MSVDTPQTAAQPQAEQPQAEQPRAEQSQARTANLKFGDCDGFLRELRRRVDQYFDDSGRRTRDSLSMYIKTLVILGWFAASYVLLLTVAATWWQALVLAVSLGLSMAAIGFNIQHDGGHSAYSRVSWINSLAAMTLDLLGGSSYLWKRRHNVIHHTYTNITGHDGDIDLGILGRLSPHQPRRPFHALQHLYLWILYGFVAVKWQFYDDFFNLFRGQIGESRFPRPKGWDLAILVIGKLLFFSLAFGVPLLMGHAWYVVLAFYLVASFVQGLMLSIVFQLAHVLEDAEFPMPEADSGRIESAWAIHQLRTTVNCACRNPLVTWYVGGLNFQIEHHLFPQICHVNYPAISHVVEQTCADFGIDYRSHRTLSSAIASHYRWLKSMGRKVA